MKSLKKNLNKTEIYESNKLNKMYERTGKNGYKNEYQNK